MDTSSPLPPLQPSSVKNNNRPARSTLEPSHAHPRSCTFCRHRKVKCDRQQPCSSCVRACHGPRCVYPPGPGRAAKQSRKTLNSEVLDRLSRLETIIRRQALPESETSSTGSVEINKHSLDTENTSLITSSLDHSSSVDQQLGRLVIDETRSYYISNILWANLSSEIKELRNLLAEPTSENEDSIYENTSFPPLGSNAAILGFRALAHSLQSYHPPLPESVALLQVFVENVVPMVRIFHMPTTIRMYWDVIARLHSIDKNTEALLFAIYYSAVISMGPEQCINIMGMSREAAIEKYRCAVEQAMARANLLDTQSIILLQAAVLYLSALRNEDDSRTVWSLTSLVFHIAQTMGLHRDGTAFGLKPFETELRRRLWLHICLLDQRSSEYHGGEPIVREFTFDTKAPLHINDSDLIPEMITPPPEREGFCEMTFSLIRSQAMRTAWKISHVPPSMHFPGRPPDGLSLKERQILAEELKDRIRQHYLAHCDNRVPFQLLSMTVARLIIARTWLVVHWPPGGSAMLQCDADMRDQLFLTSVEVLEQSSLILTNKDISKWTWHSKTHIQWHAVAFVLSEICSRPPSPDCDRAWGYVCTVYDVWNIKEHDKQGTLWGPINRLMARARYVREMQRSSYGGRAVPLTKVSEGEEIQRTSINGDLEYLPATNTASEVMDMNDMQSVLGMQSLDPFMELFPESFGINPLGLNQDCNVFP